MKKQYLLIVTLMLTIIFAGCARQTSSLATGEISSVRNVPQYDRETYPEIKISREAEETESTDSKNDESEPSAVSNSFSDNVISNVIDLHETQEIQGFTANEKDPQPSETRSEEIEQDIILSDSTENTESNDISESQDDERLQDTESSENTNIGYAEAGTQTYRGFIIDNVYHSPDNGDIHYNVYIPNSYSSCRSYALYFTLPGYEGLYFQGVAQNLKSEAFGFEAQKYNSRMIIVAPQLSYWGETSADQTIALAEYFLSNYNIDRSKVYASGYSGGGETMSIVMGKRPDLFTAYLHCSSQWDGNWEVLAQSRTPVYIAVGRDDEYYGSAPSQRTYDALHELYEKQGLTERQIKDILVLDIKERSYFTDRGMNNEHGGGGLFAYDEEIMGWLFNI